MKLNLVSFIGLLLTILPCLAGADDLSAKLENARYEEKTSSVTLDFVLTNQSKAPIKIAERWNSWGHRQWAILMTNSDGSKFEFGNQQMNWSKNYLTVATIRPEGEHRTKCRLLLREDQLPWTKGISDFVAYGQKGYFAPPLTLQGRFSVERLSKEDAVETNWTGTVTSPAVEGAK